MRRTKRNLTTAVKALHKQQSLQKARLERAGNGDKNATVMSRKEERLYNKYDKNLSKAYKNAAKDVKRMDNYKSKESAKIEKRYGLARKEKQANKAIDAFEKTFNNPASFDKDIYKQHDKAVKKLSDYYTSKGLARIEKTNLYNKNLKEISRDSVKAGRSMVFNIILSPAPITGAKRHVRNLSRMNGVDQSVANNEYAKAYERASRELKRW